MALITYIEPNGTARKVEVPTGQSVMQGAINNAINGIIAECGGGLACATCHCYVDDAWIDRVGPLSQAEDEMLDATSSERQRGSRLSCQITVTDELDGLIVRLPPTQF
jgi:2Fe-2S ferredoxin